MRRRVRSKKEGSKEGVKGQEETRRRPGGGGEECCLPEQFYCLQIGPTRDELLQSQTGLSECAE